MLYCIVVLLSFVCRYNMEYLWTTLQPRESDKITIVIDCEVCIMYYCMYSTHIGLCS
jgi:hypothetical protein